MAAFWLFLERFIENNEKIKIIVNLKLLEENWYNLQENYSSWRSMIWWQVKTCSSSGSGFGTLITWQPQNQEMLPFWNKSKHQKIATANLHQITQSFFQAFAWRKMQQNFTSTILKIWALCCSSYKIGALSETNYITYCLLLVMFVGSFWKSLIPFHCSFGRKHGLSKTVTSARKKYWQ